MDRLKSLSLKKALSLIVTITAAIVIILSVISVRICSNIHDQILLSHAFIMEPTVISPEQNGSYTISAKEDNIDDNTLDYTDEELLICRVTEILMIVLPVLFSFAGIGCASSLFYHVKLKEPLTALKSGISHIADNDLSFSIDYQKQDELGQICIAFETMRRELSNNNRRMWELLDERKKINASISHDLRTPITVIKGYSEYLDRNIGKNVLTADGMREIAMYIHQAADRLEDYANSVHEVQALEDMNLDYHKISLFDLQKEIQAQLSILSKQSKTEITILGELPQTMVRVAPAAIFRILENLVSNSFRYCKSKIEIGLSYMEPFLTITVTDDGKGFSVQDLTQAVNYFYKGKNEKEHFGIGLTICKILAEKHGGSISLANAANCGAMVTVKIESDTFSL